MSIRPTLRLGALVGAAMLTAATLAAATPAHAGNAPLTLQSWVEAVQQQVDEQLRTPAPLAGRSIRGNAVAHVRLKLDEAGEVERVWLAQRSGNPAVDAEALRVAGKLDALPPLPEGLRGRPATVELRVAIGANTDLPKHEQMQAEAERSNEALAEKIDDRPAERTQS